MTRLRGLTSVVVALLSGSLSCGGGQPVLPSSASKTGDAAAAAVPTPAPNLGPPNVVLILADDLGWGDLGSYGNRTIHTPNLDRLAAEGARFTSFYVPAPICAPSRAGLLTGRFPPRVGIPWNPPTRLNDGEVVLAKVLKAGGYATGMVGKWHLGWERDDMPIHHGFDFYYGIPAGEDESDFVLGDSLDDRHGALLPSWRDATRARPSASSATTGSRRLHVRGASRSTPRQLPRRASSPATRAPAPTATSSSSSTPASATLMALAAWMQNLDRNTLVLFMSDNGPVTPPGSPGPFSGGKFSCEEGGVRVPLITRWPARIPAGRVVHGARQQPRPLPDDRDVHGCDAAGRSHTTGKDISRLLTGQVERIGGQGIDGGREIVFFGPSRPSGAALG